jgi:Short C-terminal domain
VAGTATAVSNRVSRRQAGRWAQQDQQAQQPDEPTRYAEAPPAPEATADPMDAKLAQLQQLGELKAQGVLSESEFAAQKARILGS